MTHCFTEDNTLIYIYIIFYKNIMNHMNHMCGVAKIVAALLYIISCSIVDTNIKYLTNHYVREDNEYRVLYFTISHPISLIHIMYSRYPAFNINC